VTDDLLTKLVKEITPVTISLRSIPFAVRIKENQKKHLPSERCVHPYYPNEIALNPILKSQL
jgi:hypothetical protein